MPDMTVIANIEAQTNRDALSSKRGDMADRDTPLIRNDWYVAALAEEVTRKPIGRTILEQDVVLYRREDGTAVALQNRCAHRSFPLSQGILEGDNIVCRYHGIQYTSEGRCALVPSSLTAIPSLRLQSYPAVERGPFIWIWTGSADAVDYDKLKPQPWFEEPGWSWISGRIFMAASYLGLHENLFDLTHFSFLHGFPIPAEAIQPEVNSTAGGVSARTSVSGAGILPTMLEAAQLTEPVNSVGESLVVGPGMHLNTSIEADSSTPSKIFHRVLMHCTTPETQTKTHYFWAVARDIVPDNVDVDAESAVFFPHVFNEDKEALELIEELVSRDRRPEFREKLIAADRGGVQVLRFLAHRANEERAEGQ